MISSIVSFFSNPQALISAFGLIGIIIIIFLETGFFFGFFLPGDSLLFTAGLLASQGHLPIAALLVGVFIAAVVGDNVGYVFGKKVGPALFSKDDSVFFDKKNIARAQHFYEKYGVRTIILARFVPIVRTFAPIVAGIGNMDYKTFFINNILGGFLWTVLLIGLGYGFGHVIPDPDRFLLPAIGVIIVLSLLPALREVLRRRKQ
ncbi:MAG: VTT domain-containing protein [Candidatus Taylorbacteria bacterium]|nr:VTT domain-containing protein [Candidatus Taylorbacteria bacterium]